MVSTVINDEFVPSRNNYKVLYNITYVTKSEYIASSKLTIGELIRECPWLDKAKSIVKIDEVRVV